MRVSKGALLCTSFGIVVSLWVLGMSRGVEQTSDLRAEKLTVARIHDLGLRIEEYGLESNGRSPRSLDALKEMFELPQERFEDGWGRALYFFATESQCMLVSFGRNGKPDPQVAPPGGSVPYRDHDADIVWINGEWAQTPFGIGR